MGGGDVRQAAVVGELDSVLLELVVERRDLLVVELELGQDLGEGRQVYAVRLLGVLHQRAQLVMAHGARIASLASSITRSGSGPYPRVESKAVKAPDTLWELVFLMVILKIPIAYLCYVVWYAIKAEPRGRGGPAGVRVIPDPPPPSYDRLHPRSRRRPPRPHGGYARTARAAAARAARIADR